MGATSWSRRSSEKILSWAGASPTVATTITQAAASAAAHAIERGVMVHLRREVRSQDQDRRGRAPRTGRRPLTPPGTRAAFVRTTAASRLALPRARRAQRLEVGDEPAQCRELHRLGHVHVEAGFERAAPVVFVAPAG